MARLLFLAPFPAWSTGHSVIFDQNHPPKPHASCPLPHPPPQTALLARLAVQRYGADPRLEVWVQLSINCYIPVGECRASEKCGGVLRSWRSRPPSTATCAAATCTHPRGTTIAP